MKLLLIPPAKSLNKAYLKQPLKRQQIELFKKNLDRLFQRINENESEEHLKNIVSDFLKDTFYKETNEINTKNNEDLVVHNGKSSSDPVGVIIEAKRPANKAEMISKTDGNSKAFHELILYYLRETIDEKNHTIKHLIVTNTWEWFIFDAVWFEKNIQRNTKLVKEYELWKTSGHDTKHFYEKIASKYLEILDEKTPCTYFSLKDFETIIQNDETNDDVLLVNLYKVLSPEHLLKIPFVNDSNSLNKEFYNELLHIIGLTESKDGGKKTIQRKPDQDRDDGSLLENTVRTLIVTNKLKKVTNLSQYGENENDQLFSVGLELCITWLNRILFLKLLEGQLIKYHRGDKQQSFLHTGRIEDYDELNEMFFEVLAVPVDERERSVKTKFSGLPYLNSSLFEETALESDTVFISALKGRFEIPVYSHTVLRDSKGKRLGGTKKTLEYLFEFLDAYDFASDGNEGIQEENKTMINASVLGLIFEKINGYKDGSYFTPGFITMYMCRETIRKAVIQKFSEIKTYKLRPTDSFEDLKDRIDRTDKNQRARANEIINSLKICDPAVGSGHFLVSALNEIIAIKSELQILSYRDGSRVKGFSVSIENDELIITNEEDDQLFDYRLNANGKPIDDLQNLQEVLFHEKQMIIENCLFGVDINPKSVMICRLRLWIELLKNAYYTSKSKYKHLETLPNIDINIKCGNSLVSRYAVDADLSDVFKKEPNMLGQYSLAVAAYKTSTSKEKKGELQKFIDGVKEKITKYFSQHDPLNVKLSKLKGQLILVENKASIGNLFEKLSEKDIATDVVKLKSQIQNIEQEIEEAKSNKLYENSFEWRFEFPEVLDAEGKYNGFDVIIGNPPYIPGKDLDITFKKYLKENYRFASGKFDLYLSFIEKCLTLLKQEENLTFIIPNTLLANENAILLRKYLIDSDIWEKAIILDETVFAEAFVESIILKIGNVSVRQSISILDKEFNLIRHVSKNEIQTGKDYRIQLNIDLNDKTIITKIEKNSIALGEIVDFCIGIQLGGEGDSEEFKSKYISDKKVSKEYKKMLDGKDFEPYIIKWSGNYIKYGNWLHRKREDKYFKNTKIMIRQIGAFPISTIDENGFYTLNTIYNGILTSDKYNLKYVFAIINSKLIKYYWKKNFNDGKTLFPKIKKTQLVEIPISNTTSHQDQISKLTDTIMSKKRDSLNADTETLEAQIDELVYEIYGLTEEEIKIVEEE
jgi:adenine-specific DNA-methyltransferase